MPDSSKPSRADFESPSQLFAVKARHASVAAALKRDPDELPQIDREKLVAARALRPDLKRFDGLKIQARHRQRSEHCFAMRANACRSHAKRLYRRRPGQFRWRDGSVIRTVFRVATGLWSDRTKCNEPAPPHSRFWVKRYATETRVGPNPVL